MITQCCNVLGCHVQRSNQSNYITVIALVDHIHVADPVMVSPRSHGLHRGCLQYEDCTVETAVMGSWE